MLRIKGSNGNSVCRSPSIFFCYIVVSPAFVALSLTELRCRGLFLWTIPVVHCVVVRLLFMCIWANPLKFTELYLGGLGELSKFVRRFE